MAQSGYTPISLYFSATGAAVPTAGNLVAGELALNTNDGKLYFKNSVGVVTLLAGSTSGPAGGSNTQVQYNNSGVLAGITGATTNGTVLTLVTPVLGVATATSLQGIIGNVTPAAGNFTTLGASSTATLNTLVSSGATLTGGTINGMTVGATTATTGAFTSLTTSSTVTHNGGTANGVAYLNGSKVLTTGSALVFDGTNLSVNGGRVNALTADVGGTIGGTAQFVTVNTNGAVGDFSGIRFNYFNSADSGGKFAYIGAVLTSGASSGLADLVFGVKSSIATTTISEQMRLTSAGLAITGTLSATGTLSGGTSGTAYSFSGSAPATSLTLDSSGNLGIGTSSPSNYTNYKTITVNGTNGGAVDLMTNGTVQGELICGTDNFGIGAVAASGVLTLRAGGNVERARIDSSGNMGIGTSSPLKKLDVSVSTTASIGQYLRNSTINLLSLIDGTSSAQFGTETSHPLLFITGNIERARITSAGYVETTSKLSIGSAATAGVFHYVVGTNNGDVVAYWSNPLSTLMYTGLGNVTYAGGENGADAALYVRKGPSTSRSINAAGTVNAAGLDYAEYMKKSGNFTIAKGDICGVDANGKLTNVFADAVSFVVKSTNPSYVGGDVWGSEECLGLAKPKQPEDDAIEEEKTQYATNKTAFDVALETARQTVDRIAFAGQVPVNVTGAFAGQYIIPVNNNGAIKGEAVSGPTFEQYQISVGKVIAIESDGRAKIIVKVA